MARYHYAKFNNDNVPQLIDRCDDDNCPRVDHLHVFTDDELYQRTAALIESAADLHPDDRAAIVDIIRSANLHERANNYAADVDPDPVMIETGE